uniref:Uncharacterized protein n=1 Tax=Anguilla anguilla TaxID=7936 RepID=A0A0E9WZK1_ANGAN
MEWIYGTALTQVITRVAIFQISQGQENKQTNIITCNITNDNDPVSILGSHLLHPGHL